jgi:uncharacterized protein with NRDE domain
MQVAWHVVDELFSSMCTIAILFHVADSPLVLAANRDELYARPTRPPEVLAPGIVGGVDALSGGTWLAIRRDGRFVAVTNQRALAPVPQGLRSRGLAVLELAAAADPEAYVAAIDPRQYASMNLVWGDADAVSIAYCRQATGERTIDRLAPGIHVLCNDRLGAPGFPRGARLARAAEAAIAAGGREALLGRLATALGDHTRASIEPEPTGGDSMKLAPTSGSYDDLTPARLPPELAHAMTATCIHTEHYGTRSASIVAIDSGRVTAYLHADGPPCTTPFEDRRGLL